MSIWKEGNPAHLTEAACKDIASVLTGQAALLTRSDPTQPARRRIDSVVAGEGGSERVAVREPGWMSNSGGRGGGWSASQWGRTGQGKGQDRVEAGAEAAAGSATDPTPTMSSEGKGQKSSDSFK